ncbi:MAG: Cof-type HAD-IIB family hydrolase [Tissierellales bacterium]|nr:Cof-type HAD-IIB family hydrolase [Tissierellales bacterium]MBN2828141.1 Cof-type HAD-IIB family hydrolase [Tissierellales bacterium]
MRFKAVALDLDGTLLNQFKLIEQETIDYLNRLALKDVRIIIATGRSYYDAERLTSLLPFDFVIAANNGSITVNSKSTQVISSSFISNTDYKKIIASSRYFDLHPIVYVHKYSEKYDIIAEHDSDFEAYNGYLRKKLDRYKKIDLFSYNDDDILSVCFAGQLELLKEFRNYIDKSFPGTFGSSMALKLSIEALLEFLHPDSCKWQAILRYCMPLGIQPSQIITIGDDNNDLIMLEKAGLGIAMINGTDESKAYADRISCYPNTEQGVLYELQRIFGE